MVVSWSLLVQAIGIAGAIATAASGMTILQRATGVFVLESYAGALAVVMWLLGPRSGPGHLSLLLLGLTAFALSCLLLPFYRRLRQSLFGESISLLLSYAILNALVAAMTIMSGGSYISAGARFSSPDNMTPKILLFVALCFGLTHWILGRRGNRAAVQLARDDARLLSAFGHRSATVQYMALLGAIALVVSGLGFFVVLQDVFGTTSGFGPLITLFSVALANTQIRLLRVAITSLFIVASDRMITQLSSPLLGTFYEGMLFIAVVTFSAWPMVRWRFRALLPRSAYQYTRISGN